MDATALRANVIALNTERIAAIEAQRAAILDCQGRERSGEEQAKIDRIGADIARIAREVTELVALETQFTEADQIREAQARAYGDPGENRVVSIRNAEAELRAFLRGDLTRGSLDWDGKRSMEIDIRGVQREKELLRMGASAEEIRQLAWDTGSSASLVPTTLARVMYQYMEASNGILRAPTRKINTSNGETIQFPKLGAHAIATQVIAQGTAIAGTDPTFLRMQLDAFKIGELVKVANEVITDSGIDMSSFLGEDLGRAVGRLAAQFFTVGTGSGQPQGLLTAIVGAGTIATGGSLITPTVEKMIDLKYSVNDEYRNDPSCAWLMNDSTAGTLSKLRDGAGGTVGAFLWRPSLTNGVVLGAPDTFLDKPVYIETNVAAQGSNAKSVAFGAMNAFYIRQVGNPVIESSSEAGFSTDETWIRAKWRVDSDLIDATAVNAIKQSV